MATVTLYKSDYNSGITPTIACIGDSLTAGAGGTPYPTQLGYIFADRLIYNLGIGGQTAQQICGRIGSSPIYLTISGNAFNNTTAVSVTSINNQALSTPAQNNTTVASGTILGISALLTRTATGTAPSQVETYTLTPVISSTASIPAGSQFIPDDGFNHQNHIQVTWLGRNNAFPLLGTVDVLVDACVAQMKRPRRFLTLGILTALNETINTTNYNTFTAYNAALAAKYPNNYIAMTPPTAAEMSAIGFTPQAQDLIDIANGTFPTNMRADNIHLNTSGYAIVANRVAQKILDLGW